MSDYLKNLQESVILNHQIKPEPHVITAEDFADIIDGNPDRLTEAGFATLVPEVLIAIWKKLKHSPAEGLPDIGNIISKIAEAPATPHVLGAAIGIAAAIYTRKMLIARKKCKDAPDKDACKKQMKVDALKSKLAIITAGKKKCNTSSCHAKADSKIAAVKTKMTG